MNILEQDRGAPDTRQQSDSFFQDFTKHDFEDWLRTGLDSRNWPQRLIEPNINHLF